MARRLRSPDLPRLPENYVDVELRTLQFVPVYRDSAGNPENYEVWDGLPSGSITLSQVNPETWAKFELNKVYKVNFTPAE